MSDVTLLVYSHSLRTDVADILDLSKPSPGITMMIWTQENLGEQGNVRLAAVPLF
jgi:hypothetical protein